MTLTSFKHDNPRHPFLMRGGQMILATAWRLTCRLKLKDRNTILPLLGIIFLFFVCNINCISLSADEPEFKAVPGTILVEYWRDVDGGGIKDLKKFIDFPDLPREFKFLTNFEIPMNQDDCYGTRIRGYVLPPETGNYLFWISADDAGELWLSDSTEPKAKKKIGYLDAWTLPQEWEKFPTQKSVAIHLEKGKKYYIEALHKEGGVNDHLSVGWQLPSGSKEMPIPGIRLEPWSPPKNLSKSSGVRIKITTPPPMTPGYYSLTGTFNYLGKEYPFGTAIYLPEDYVNSKEIYPLITTLHNEVGTVGGVTGDHPLLASEGMAALMLQDIGFDTRYSGEWPSTKINPRKDIKFIGLIPQCPLDRAFQSMPMSGVVVEIINWMGKTYRMDPDRVFLTGYSYGGACTWAVAQQFPERFAAIIPLSARLAPEAEKSPEILKNVGVWCGSGNEDWAFEFCNQMANIYKKAGHTNFHYKSVKGGNHFCYNAIYADPELWTWLLAQKRKPITSSEKK